MSVLAVCPARSRRAARRPTAWRSRRPDPSDASRSDHVPGFLRREIGLRRPNSTPRRGYDNTEGQGRRPPCHAGGRLAVARRSPRGIGRAEIDAIFSFFVLQRAKTSPECGSAFHPGSWLSQQKSLLSTVPDSCVCARVLGELVEVAQGEGASFLMAGLVVVKKQIRQLLRRHAPAFLMPQASTPTASGSPPHANAHAPNGP